MLSIMGGLKLFQSFVCLGFIIGLGIITANSHPPLQLNDFQTWSYPENQFSLRSTSERFRLPKNVTPIAYNLEIIPILDTTLGEEKLFTAPGSVEIYIKCQSSTQTITLHSKEIKFTKNDVTVKNLTTIENNPSVVALTFHPELETVDIELDNPLEENAEYAIKINFQALVNDDLDGLYRSTYIAANGQERYIATTQFEKTGARRAFPCFDEPSLRAIFNVKIGHTGDYHALANGELVRKDEEIPDMPGWVYDTFQQTPVMPTYLVAIIVSDFTEEKAPGDSFRMPVSTWGPPNQMIGGTGVFSAQVAAKLLAYYESYFEHEYQMTKLDSIAIPDFAAGAMENWGLNTYRVPYMLFFPGDSTQFEQWRQAAVIAHEVSHSWFGNLVTMNWWNDLWIKEGFARYLQFLGVEEVEPQLEAMNRAVLDITQIAMQNDFGPNTHPIRGNWTEDIQYQNSRIIYEKGAALIRMMQAFLTEPTLQQGLRNYLTSHAFDSAIQDDMFSELTIQANADGIELPDGLNVKDIMDTWTLQSGYPIVKVSKAGSSRLFLSQEKFVPLGEQSLPAKELWEIPINIATKENPDFTENNFRPITWIHKTQALMSFEMTNTEQWMVVNPDTRNYYRVLYDEYYSTLLKEQLDNEHTVISPSSRSQLFDDYYTLAEHGYLTIDKAMNFTTFLENEETLTVWSTVLSHWRKFYTLMVDTMSKETFEIYVKSKIEPQLAKVGGVQIPSEPPITSMLRAQLLDWGCATGSEICYKSAVNQMQNWMADAANNPIMADIQASIFCAAYAKGDQSLREFIRQQYENSAVSVRQQGLLLNSMACSLTETEQTEKLEILIDETETMKKSDRVILLQKISETSSGRNLIIPFLVSYKDKIVELLGESSISTAISTLSNNFASEERREEVAKFLADNSDLSQTTKDSIQQSITKIGANMKWLNTHHEVLRVWLDQNSP